MYVVYQGNIVEVIHVISSSKHDKYVFELYGQTIKVPETVCDLVSDAITVFRRGDRVLYRRKKYIINDVIINRGWNLLHLIRESDNVKIRGVIDASQCKKILRIEAKR